VSSDGYAAWVSFDNPEWDPAAFTARCGLLYNATKANRSIVVLDFGADKTAVTKFTVQLPQATATSALIRSSN
jgi:beta-glucosidase/6-phospho-beta-glucosidase/beta-galactosidase